LRRLAHEQRQVCKPDLRFQKGGCLATLSPEELVVLFGRPLARADTDFGLGGEPLDDSMKAAVTSEGKKWLDALHQVGGGQLGDCSFGDVGSAWVLKEADKDCGKGVEVHSRLFSLLASAKRCDWRIVVQRYVPDPMLLSRRRKFDLRQWVLVTSWSPAVCWAYPVPYLRLSSRAFDENARSFNDPLVHLTNRCVQQDSDCIWLLDEFFKWADGGGLNIDARKAWTSLTWPKISEAIRTTVLAGQAEVGKHHAGCFQLFGFDFILDSSMRPWLLEVNSNPDLCCDAGPDLQSLVDEKLAQMLKLVAGLSDASLKLPDRSGSLDEAVNGAGRWRLLLRQRPFDTAKVAQETYFEEQRKKGADEFTVDRAMVRNQLLSKPQEATIMKWLEQVPGVPSFREDPIVELMGLGACAEEASNSAPRSPSKSPRKAAASVDSSPNNCPRSPSLSTRKAELPVGGHDCSKPPLLSPNTTTVRSPRSQAVPSWQRCVSLATPKGQAGDHTRSRSVVAPSMSSATSTRLQTAAVRSRSTLTRGDSAGDTTCGAHSAAVDRKSRRRLPNCGELPRLAAERFAGSQGRLVST